MVVSTMKKNLIFISLAITILLTGCAAKQALQDMKDAKTAYKSCLAENPKNPEACTREKEAYETAGQNYDGMGGAANNGNY